LDKDDEKLLAACVVLYNPTDSIIQGIKSYLNFTNALYIIDNSDVIDHELVEKIIGLSTKIIYIQQNENIGIASALNIGARLALNAKYHWLLTMDQDSYFSGSEFFDTWYNNIHQNAEIGLLAASYTSEYDRWQKEYSAHYNEIHFVVTSGNIINLKAWKNIGGFEEKLFIDEVDHDYCLKLRKNGYRLLTSKKVLMGHIIGEFYEGKEGKKQFTLHNPVRYYYMSRNVLYLCKKYFFIDFNFALARFYYLVKILIKIVLNYPDKMIYLRFFFEGLRDFTLSKYNKYDH
jgi:rhamnosyltransferase